MHVVYVIDSVARGGGAEQALVEMAPLLVEGGVRLDVVHLRDVPGFQPQLRAAGARVFGLPATARAGRVARLRGLLRELRPDLVHTTLFEADVAGRTAAALAGVPVVSSLVNSAYGPEHRSAPGLRPWRVRAAQALDAATARRVVRFHALTRHVAVSMAARLRLDPARIEVVPRGRAPERLGDALADDPAARSRRARVRAGLGLPGDVPVVLAAARHQHQKGLDVLLRAWGVVVARRPDAVLLVAGPAGAQTPLLRRLAAALPDGTVRLLGAREDVPELMGAAEAFVAPSRWEGLGSAAMEALGVGVPLVVSDVPALRETVGSERHALLVPPESSWRLAEALLASLEDRSAALRRARAGREHFLAHFTLERVTRRMVELYARALAEAGGPGGRSGGGRLGPYPGGGWGRPGAESTGVSPPWGRAGLDRWVASRRPAGQAFDRVRIPSPR
ncbi:glycosyltransferase family 4 protein [Allostreptomyces psammosilenae]|uniref:D-inositol 3-phosphate glycosyltransferase n=1 Tax=Allostreptomyces psammosilenae TaxID=1892865 RepID=A0A853A024_9ACTN|nr:glycosyltransferase family 4 protein [Allostreptomyces psammosilenae]NYI07457.1 glycosyltransferase involved in cell wall biosynthesis [Allostreptomyces psammosilenae]